MGSSPAPPQPRAHLPAVWVSQFPLPHHLLPRILRVSELLPNVQSLPLMKVWGAKKDFSRLFCPPHFFNSRPSPPLRISEEFLLTLLPWPQTLDAPDPDSQQKAAGWLQTCSIAGHHCCLISPASPRSQLNVRETWSQPLPASVANKVTLLPLLFSR